MQTPRLELSGTVTPAGERGWPHRHQRVVSQSQGGLFPKEKGGLDDREPVTVTAPATRATRLSCDGRRWESSWRSAGSQGQETLKTQVEMALEGDLGEEGAEDQCTDGELGLGEDKGRRKEWRDTRRFAAWWLAAQGICWLPFSA